MIAARYVGNGHMEVGPAAAAAPQPGEVAVDVAYTGICGTDLHIIQGHMDNRVRIPAIIGHEMSGRIAELGSDVRGWEVGRAVSVIPLRSCGQCPACRDGNAHICHRLDVLGVDSSGAMQTRWIVPAERLVALPDSMSLRRAAFVEPLAVAVHDVRRGEVRPGEHVVVVGAGPVGALIAQVAAHQGAEVVVVEPDEHRRTLVTSLGVQGLDSVEDVSGWVDRWTSGKGADVAFEVSGSEAGLGTALAVLGVQGRLVAVGIHSQPRRVDMHRVFWRELTIVGARLYRRKDFEDAAALIHSDEVMVDPLLSQVVPLQEAARAFEVLASGAGVMKVLVDCGGEL